MVDTAILQITKLEQNAGRPDVVLNEMIEELEQSANAEHSITLAGSPATATLTDAEYNYHVLFNVTGTGPGTLVLPNRSRLIAVDNQTGGQLTVQTGSAAVTVQLDDGERAILYNDGSDEIIKIVGEIAAGSGSPYDVGFFFPDVPSDSENVVFVITRSLTLPASATGSSGYANTAPNAQYDIDIQKNGASIGTIRFAAASNTCTFVSVIETTFTTGDRLELITPAVGSPAEVIADIAITLQLEK